MSIKIAVVTGANKGIGFAIVRGLCKRFDGKVYLTSRDVKRGEDAVTVLNQEGLHPNFHQPDITDKQSIAVFRDYIKGKYGFIDILVNNAAIAFKNEASEPVAVEAEQTLFVNYFSVLSACEILFPILRDGARVINLSSSCGHLSLIPSEKLRKAFQDPNLTVEELSNLMNQYIEAAKQGCHEADWGSSSYVVSKVRIRIFDYGVPSVPVEHISLRQCHVVWRKHEGGCTVKEIMLHNRRMHVKKRSS